MKGEEFANVVKYCLECLIYLLNVTLRLKRGNKIIKLYAKKHRHGTVMISFL